MTTYSVNDIIEVTFTHSLIDHTIKAICVKDTPLFLTVSNNKVYFFDIRINNQIQFIYLGYSVDNPIINNQFDIDKLRNVLVKEINKVSTLNVIPNLFKHLENLELSEVDIYCLDSQRLFKGDINKIDYISGNIYVNIDLLDFDGEYNLQTNGFVFNDGKFYNNKLVLLEKDEAKNLQDKLDFKRKMDKIINSMNKLESEFIKDNLLFSNYNKTMDVNYINRLDDLITDNAKLISSNILNQRVSIITTMEIE